MSKGGRHVYQHVQIHAQGCELPALYRVCEKAGLHLVVAKSAYLRFRRWRKLRPLPCSSSPHKVCDFAGAPNLLTSNDDIYRHTANCFCKDGIEFGYAVLKNTSPHNYALFMAARDLCDKTTAVTMADLAEPEVIDPEALRLIVNATLIARYGLAAFQIRARGAEYER